MTELWRVRSGEAAGRTNASQVTVFDSVGFALEDYSALSFIRDMAHEHHIGKSIELIPALRDPKNLFGALQLQHDCQKQTEFA